MQPDGQKALTWQRYRDFHAGRCVLVALRLEPAEKYPTLNDLATALDHPARPLFIGRKPCLPSGRLFAGWIEADNVAHALQIAPQISTSDKWELQWPDGEGRMDGDRVFDLCDERNWTSGVHGGWRQVRQAVFTAKGS